EKTFGPGTYQQLFTLRGGDGLLLTTAKWASADGKTFLNDERADSGVKPSVEVKRPEVPTPLDPQDVEDQSVENQQPNPQATPTPAPTPMPKSVQPEDVQLKKALEILQGSANQTMQKAA
ncbi:MAG: hypothetical protein ACR2LT_08755, partial [Pyrinomonadaceae bacterium]